jgi:hypothetical protein
VRLALLIALSEAGGEDSGPSLNMISTRSGLNIDNFGCVWAVNGGINMKIVAGTLLLILACLEGTATLAASLLGSGLGVDHVGVVVRNLDVAKSDFERLGFTVSSGGSFPGGLSNKIINFENGTYLELLAVQNLQPVKDEVAELAGFARKHEGAMFLGLEVSSAEETLGYLRARNFDVKDPQPGSITQEGHTDKPKVPLWYTVEMNDKPAPEKKAISLPIFFIQYSASRPTNSRAKQREIHANTASAIRSVWMVVSNLSAQIQTLHDAGFQPSTAKVKFLGAQGRAFKAGAGQIVLLDAKDKSPAVQEYVAKFGEGIMGISIQVHDIQKAGAAVESGTHTTFANIANSRRLVVLPALAHGIWIEMTEKSQLQ